MASLCVEVIDGGSYIILKVKFASKELIKKLKIQLLHLITRLRYNAVGKNPSPTPTLKHSRGRARFWCESVKLPNLFEEKDCFTKENLMLEAKIVTLRYRCFVLH